MHRTTCARYACAEYGPNTLVSETNPENWHLTRKFTNDGCRYSSLNWSARTGGDDNRAGPEVSKFAHIHRVVPDDTCCCTKLAKISRNVEDKRVVVVDNDNQDAPASSAMNARKMRSAFARLSSYSAAGSDIAVIPAPAWKTAWPSSIVTVRMAIFTSISPLNPM